jgi:hypothetical protein
MTSATIIPAIGPHSRRTTLAKIDGRRREAKLMREVIDELTRHVGGNPSSIQRRMIERAAKLSLFIELMDRSSIGKEGMSEQDSRKYLAFSNSLVRLLRELGVKAKSDEPASEVLEAYIGRHADAGEGEDAA